MDKYSFKLTLALLLLTTSSFAISKHFSLQDILNKSANSHHISIIQAKEIVTLDPNNAIVEAVAIKDGKILATGSLKELKAQFSKEPHTVNREFDNLVLTPGFIAQHDHPLLAGITMTSEVIAIEDWVTPDRTFKAAKNHDDYIKKLTEAEKRMKDPKEILLTWGYHHYFHGQLKQSELDEISATRPIIVWHRSAHEMYINSAAEKNMAFLNSGMKTYHKVKRHNQILKTVTIGSKVGLL